MLARRFTDDTPVTMKKDQFLANRQNKKRFISMLSEELAKKDRETHHASGDADLLIVQKVVQSATSCNTVLVGDDTDLLVLLCYHASLESHDLLFCPEPKKNTKQPCTWNIKVVKTRLGPDMCQHILFIVDREVLTDKHVIANRLNTFFTNIGPKPASQIVTDGNSSYEDFLINPTLHEFNFNQIGEEDVVNVIDKLPSKTSSGVDGISTNLLKDIKYIISKPLTLIINQCLETGIFPSKLKVAKVIPILKRGDETIFDNYRPISILPAISKVFERIIFNQIHNYFHVNDLYFCSQYGFRKEHSTELAVLELVDRITQHLDKGTTPINVYLDLSKAFDTLDHNILLHKLKYYGIEGTALRLFESYLNERQQYVDLDGTNSNYNRILTGVPQGSILGPLLFIIYINDIAQSSNHFNFIIYADDTTLCSTLKINADATKLNRELNNVSHWLNLNKLSLNVKKTKAMVFRMPQKKIIQPNIQINGSNIEFVENFIFLGITINNKLNWNSHINKVTKQDIQDSWYFK